MNKIEHNSVTYDADFKDQSFETQKNTFKIFYEEYRKCREVLHNLEVQGQDTSSTYEKLIAIKEELSKIVINIYANTKSLDGFEKKLRELISYNASISLEEVDDYIFGAYIYPPSLIKKELRSPVEAIYATVENLKIIANFTEVGKKHGEGILLSGSNSWGAFHAVKGNLHSKFTELGIGVEVNEESSDIDLLITFETVEQLGLIIDDFIKAGYISDSEKNRVRYFKKLFQNNEAEVFSIRSKYSGVEQSVHFVPSATIRKIVDGTQLKDEESVGFVMNFRPNFPGSVKKHGGYVVGDLLGENKKLFNSNPVEVIDDRNEQLGYITRMPVGGEVKSESSKAYYIGLLTFYLLIAPTILYDKNDTLKRYIAELRQKFRNILGDLNPQNIPREERMITEILDRIKKTL